MQTNQIKMDVDINDADGAGALDLIAADSDMWGKLLSKGAAGQAPAAFTPTVTARLKGPAVPGQDAAAAAHDKDMFLTMAVPVLETILTVWDTADDDQVTRRQACRKST